MSNLNSGPWKKKETALHGGMLVEICPTRLGKDFSDWAALDGWLGTILTSTA